MSSPTAVPATSQQQQQEQQQNSSIRARGPLDPSHTASQQQWKRDVSDDKAQAPAARTDHGQQPWQPADSPPAMTAASSADVAGSLPQQAASHPETSRASDGNPSSGPHQPLHSGNAQGGLPPHQRKDSGSSSHRDVAPGLVATPAQKQLPGGLGSAQHPTAALGSHEVSHEQQQQQQQQPSQQQDQVCGHTARPHAAGVQPSDPAVQQGTRPAGLVQAAVDAMKDRKSGRQSSSGVNNGHAAAQPQQQQRRQQPVQADESQKFLNGHAATMVRSREPLPILTLSGHALHKLSDHHKSTLEHSTLYLLWLASS